MTLFITALHVVLCILLVLIILLQPGKGGDVGAAFGGGGGSTMFGPRGPAGLLARATTIVAVLFMVTSITLSMKSSRSEHRAGSLEEEMELLQREIEAEREGGGEDLPVEGFGSP